MGDEVRSVPLMPHSWGADGYAYVCVCVLLSSQPLRPIGICPLTPLTCPCLLLQALMVSPGGAGQVQKEEMVQVRGGRGGRGRVWRMAG